MIEAEELPKCPVPGCDNDGHHYHAVAYGVPTPEPMLHLDGEVDGSCVMGDSSCTQCYYGHDAELAAVDLGFLSDRSRAYVMGLEAKLKEKNLQITQLREKLDDPSQRDAKAIRAAYKKGWEDASHRMMGAVQSATQNLRAASERAFQVSLDPEREEYEVEG